MILLGDLGATNARFSISRDGETYEREAQYFIEDFESIESLCRQYFLDNEIRKVEKGIIGVAAPVIGDNIKFVNANLKFSKKEIEKILFPGGLTVVNDLELQAYALFNAKNKDLHFLGNKSLNNGPKILVSPGTGLGLAGIVGNSVIATEAGHINIIDSNVNTELKAIIREFNLVSSRYPNYEDFLSGKGIEFFYRHLAGLSNSNLTSKEILLERNDIYCLKTKDLINNLLSSYLRTMALAWGATGGVFLSGSIVNSLLDEEDYESFRQEFDNSETMRDLLVDIPLAVANIQNIGFEGAIELSKRLNDSELS